jgi:hypothetical protein
VVRGGRGRSRSTHIRSVRAADCCSASQAAARMRPASCSRASRSAHALSRSASRLSRLCTEAPSRRPAGDWRGLRSSRRRCAAAAQQPAQHSTQPTTDLSEAAAAPAACAPQAGRQGTEPHTAGRAGGAGQGRQAGRAGRSHTLLRADLGGGWRRAALRRPRRLHPLHPRRPGRYVLQLVLRFGLLRHVRRFVRLRLLLLLLQR